MSDTVDTAQVIIRPPLLWALAVIVGFALNWLVPLPFVPAAAPAAWLGGGVFVLALALFAWAITTITRAGSNVPTNMPIIGDTVDWEEIVLGQRVFPRVVGPFLRELEFSNNQITRWWPLGTQRRVVLDPKRQFGQPIIFKTGVPTEVLYLAVRNGTPKDEVAKWFEVEREDVEELSNLRFVWQREILFR